VQRPFKAEDLFVPEHELGLLIDPDIKDTNLIVGLTSKPVGVKGVKFNSQDMLFRHELVVDPWLAGVAYLEVIFSGSQKVGLRDRHPANRIHIVIHAFELELGVEDCLWVRVTDQLTNDLLIYQVEAFLWFLIVTECCIKIPYEKTAVIGLVAPLIPCRDKVRRNAIPRERVAATTRNFDILVDELLFNSVRNKGVLITLRLAWLLRATKTT
jgi:hypothetical protein